MKAPQPGWLTCQQWVQKVSDGFQSELLLPRALDSPQPLVVPVRRSDYVEQGWGPQVDWLSVVSLSRSQLPHGAVAPTECAGRRPVGRRGLVLERQRPEASAARAEEHAFQILEEEVAIGVWPS